MQFPEGTTIDQALTICHFIAVLVIFLQGPTSYLDAAQTGLDTSPSSDLKTDSDSLNPGQTKQELCPYALQGECRFAERCTYLHGDICDICGKMVLLKGNKEQNEAHQKVNDKLYLTMFINFCIKILQNSTPVSASDK